MTQPGIGRAAARRVNRAAQRRRWLAHALAFAFALGCARLGVWQLDRAADKAARAGQASAASGAVPAALAGPGAEARQLGARVSVRGQWVAAATHWLDNRTHKGRAGMQLVTPLRLNDGRWLLVNRGWAPWGPARDVLPASPLPAGEVTLSGVLRAPVEGGYALGPGANGRVLARLDAAALAHIAGAQPRLEAVLWAEGGPVGPGLVPAVAPGAGGADRHRAYALQWFCFAALAIGLSGYFAWRGRRESVARA